MASTRYRATTSAKNADGELVFKGKTYGIKFEYGTAVFDDVTIQASRSKLGYTAEQIATRMQKDFGYHIEVYNEKTETWELFTPKVETTPDKPSKNKE